MTLIRHEIKQGGISLIVWTVSIAFLLVICVLLYPEMKGEMDGMSEMFSSMGSFTQAFGMDKMSLATLTGFYATEVALMHGLGGAMFAAILGSSILSKEEAGHTAEFLNTLPVSRKSILLQKYVALVSNLLIFKNSI